LPPWQVRLQTVFAPLHVVVEHCCAVVHSNVQVSAEQEAPVQPPEGHSNVHEVPPLHAAFSHPPPLQSIAQCPPSGHTK
jgi:hypothetical protein